LEVDGKEIAQSSTITRYLAKKYGFAGSNDVEEGVENLTIKGLAYSAILT
jgi:glutathione S-transferase